ncbi:unnamed protein product [Adineta steineri]|uniref:Uncharacterized protein n=1 Tax=Adineta steineri TaxID=433720 RepID=A0A815WXN9_9BILA|nr:unnamed protein product [Adineta steineri]CAF1661253.1 unnamed protein product [Adineta steineri]
MLKKLHELVSNYRIVLKIKSSQPSIITRKQQRSGSQPPNEHVLQQQNPTRHMAMNVTNKILLFSSFGWLIIDEIHYAASLGGLKVDGCMKKVQGNVSSSQRLRALRSTTNNQNTKNRQISVLDIIAGKSQALTSLQTHGIHLTLSGVTNIGTIAMDVPLRPQEVHDLLNDTIEEPTTPIPLEQTITRKRLGTRRRDTINRNINPRLLETQQNIFTSSKRPMFRLLYINERALHFLNNNNHDHQQPPIVNSDNYIRIDFPEIRWYGNYSIQQEQENKTKGGLNLRTKIDVLKLIITVNFLAQLVFVSKATIHEINEILAKVSRFDQFHFGTTKYPRLSSSSSIVPIMRIDSTDTEYENDDDEPKKDQQTTSPTLFTYKIDISMKGFVVMRRTPSNTIVKYENGDKKVPIFVKLTNYEETKFFITLY